MLTQLVQNLQMIMLVLIVMTLHIQFGCGQLEDQTVICATGHLFVAQETAEGVSVTTKSSLTDITDTQQETTTIFQSDSLPKECGDSYVRCNLTILSDFESRKTIAVVPLSRGVGLVLYVPSSGVGGNGMKYHGHFVIDLTDSIPSYNCAPINFFRVAGTVSTTSHVLGLCLNTSNEEQSNLRAILLDVDFGNLNESTLSTDMYGQTAVTLNFPGDMSPAVYFHPPAACFEDESRTLFFIDGTSLVDINLVTGTISFYEMFAVHAPDSSPTPIDCVHPRQIIRVSGHTIVAYCENTTIELDMCKRKSTTITVDAYNEGIQSYCNGDLSAHVNVHDGILMVHTSTDPFSNYSFTLPSEFKAAYSASCWIAKNTTYNIIITFANGKTMLINVNGSNGFYIELGANGLNQTIPHMTYHNQLVLFNDGLGSQLKNLICSNDRIIIDHPFHLSAYTVHDVSMECVCNTSSYVATTVPLYFASTVTIAGELTTAESSSMTDVDLFTSSLPTQLSTEAPPSNGQSSLYIIGLAAGLSFLGGMVVCTAFVIVVMMVVQRFVYRNYKQRSGSDIVCKHIKEDK